MKKLAIAAALLACLSVPAPAVTFHDLPSGSSSTACEIPVWQSDAAKKLQCSGFFAGLLNQSSAANFRTAIGAAPLVSPSFTTPALGVATGNSLALGGATIGANALAVTGSVAISSTVASAAHAITSASATAFAAGLAGATNPAFSVDASTASSATGIKVKSAAAAAGVAVSVTSSGTNENLAIDAKGSGTVTIGGTSTGAITLNRATTIGGNLTTNVTGSTQCLKVNSSGVVSGSGAACSGAGATFTYGTAITPTGTTSNTGVMMGLGSTYTITPASTGRVTFMMQCWIANSSSGANAGVKGYYGTGTAPSNAAAVTGTAFSNAFTLSTSPASGTPAIPVTIIKTITGLTPGTAYWFDVALSASAGTTSISCQNASAIEN